MAIFVGIDPGLSRGKFGLAMEKSGSPPRFAQLGVNDNRAKGIVSDFQRTEMIYAQLLEKLSAWGVIGRRSTYFAVEGPSLGRRQARTVQVGFVHDAIYRALASFNKARVITPTPSILKKFATGYGFAQKDDMVDAAKEMMAGHPGRQIPGFTSEDLWEAYLLVELAKVVRTHLKSSTRFPAVFRTRKKAGVLVHRIERKVYYHVETPQ